MNQNYNWKKVFFKPYIGKEYEKGWAGTGKKLLILGESHYSDKEESGDFTNRFIRGCLEEFNYSFFTKLTNALPVVSDTTSNKAELWDQLSFYNFVQSTVTDGRTPTDEQFTKSSEAFKEVLNQLRPEVIVVLGRRLWNAMPDDQTYQNAGQTNGKLYEEIGWYATANGEALTFPVYHPSSQGSKFNDAAQRIAQVWRDFLEGQYEPKK